MKKLLIVVLVAVVGVTGYAAYKSKGSLDRFVAEVKALLHVGPRLDASGHPLVKCPRCQGTGKMPCPNSTCKDGQIDCPGNCISLTKGKWVHLDGHPANELFQEFHYKGKSKYWSQAHVGEVMGEVNGIPTPVGQCQKCHGTTHVPDPECQGTGRVVCSLCHGAGEVPDPNFHPPAGEGSGKAAAASPTPHFVSGAPRVQDIHLKNGKTLRGQIVVQDRDVTMIRLTDGKSVQVRNKDIKP